MAIRDLIPWSRSRDVAVRRGGETDPFLTLHREMNRLFDDFLVDSGLRRSVRSGCLVVLAAGPISRSPKPTRK
jgi:hypothetical protein